MRVLAVIFALVALTALPASAHHYTIGDISIGHVWAPATSDKAETGVVYVPLFNGGTESDSLAWAVTPAADKVEFHTTTVEKGVARMRMIESIPLEPGKKATSGPGQIHLMLIGLKQPLKDGDKFRLALTFAKAGMIEVEVHVQKARPTDDELGQGHMDMDHEHMDMDMDHDHMQHD